MSRRVLVRALLLSMSSAILLWTTGCGVLPPKPPAQQAYYSFDSGESVAIPRVDGTTAILDSAPTLIVSPSHATAGFDSQRMVYVRESHRLEYFAHSRWVDTPARMLSPLLLVSLENSGGFRAVVVAPTIAAGDLRLDTEIVRLQHEFEGSSSRVRLTVRATMLDNKTRRVLASREFDRSVASDSADPRGGVKAAHVAVRMVLVELSLFGRQAAELWQLAMPSKPVIPANPR